MNAPIEWGRSWHSIENSVNENLEGELNKTYNVLNKKWII
jgi:hypothetical protein